MNQTLASVVYLTESVIATPTGLQFTRPLTYSEWCDLGVRLRDIERSVHWWIGDWIRYGEHAYGEMYTQALNETGFEYGTLANDKWVCSRFSESSSRDERLSFSHHRMVADIDDPQMRSALLDKAHEYHLTANELLEVKKQVKSGDASPRSIEFTGQVTAVESVPDDSAVDVTFRLPQALAVSVRWLLERLGLEVNVVASKAE